MIGLDGYTILKNGFLGAFQIDLNQPSIQDFTLLISSIYLYAADNLCEFS